METLIGKSATQIWRHQYLKNGGTLGFTDWINREKAKSVDGSTNLVIVDKALNDSVQTTIKEAALPLNTPAKPAGSTVFGINKTVFIISSLALAAGIGLLITQIGKR